MMRGMEGKMSDIIEDVIFYIVAVSVLVFSWYIGTLFGFIFLRNKTKKEKKKLKEEYEKIVLFGFFMTLLIIFIVVILTH